MSVKIEDEDDLLVEIGRKFSGIFREFFPKITVISRNIQVIPDIDLLELATHLTLNALPSVTTVGYEVKLLKYRERWKRVPYESLYQGIGEALCYYLYGVEQVHLILGFHHEVPTKARNRFLKILKDLTVIWEPFFPLPMGRGLKDYLGLIIWNTEDGTYEEISKLSNKFPVDQNKDLKHKKDCLTRKEFVYDKKLFKAIENYRKRAIEHFTRNMLSKHRGSKRSEQ